MRAHVHALEREDMSPSWKKATCRRRQKPRFAGGFEETTVFLPCRRADLAKRRSFWRFRPPIWRKNGRGGESAGGLGETTVFAANPRADLAKKRSFRQIGARGRQKNRFFGRPADGSGETTVLAGCRRGGSQLQAKRNSLADGPGLERADGGWRVGK